MTAVTVDGLLDLDGADFQDLVLASLGMESSAELWTLLAHPEVVGRTLRVLTARKADVQGQLSTRRAELDRFHQECMISGPEAKDQYFAARAELQTWRRGALAFMRLVDRRIGEMRVADQPRIRQAQADMRAHANAIPARRRHNKHALFALAYAVHAHRQACKEAGIAPEAHDEDLWDFLDELTVMDAYGDSQSLAEWVEDVASKPGFEPPSIDTP